eukprot:g1871.t1
MDVTTRRDDAPPEPPALDAAEPLLDAPPAETRKSAERLLSLDLMRGWIMVVMAWDHSVDILADGKLPRDTGFQAWSGHLDTYDESGGLFLARFVSHFCAPGFFYTMGIGMVLFSQSRRRRGWGWGRILRHFGVRALLLFAFGRLVDVPFYIGLLVSLYEGRTVVHRGTTFTPPQDIPKAWDAAWIGVFEVMTGLGMVMAATSLLLPLVLRRAWHGADAGGCSVALHRQLGSPLWGGKGAWLAIALGASLLALSNAVIVHYQAGDPEGRTLAHPDAWPRMGAPARDAADLLLRFALVPGYGIAPRMGPVAYPLVPWCSLTLFGVAAGAEFRAAPARAHERSRTHGALLLALFLLLRGVGGSVGNLRGWPRGDGYGVDGAWAGVPSLIEFFNVCKYPPSPAYCALTLGVDLLLLWFFWRAQHFLEGGATDSPPAGAEKGAVASAVAGGCECGRLAPRAACRWRALALRVLLTFGRVPLFFYVLHFWVYAAVRVVFGLCGLDGVPLAAVFPLYAAVLALLFFACRRYGAFKQRTPPESLWRFL